MEYITILRAMARLSPSKKNRRAYKLQHAYMPAAPTILTRKIMPPFTLPYVAIEEGLGRRSI